jgi:hypothetical protein
MIPSATLEGIADSVNGRPLDETLLAELRGGWPGMYFTLCSDDDVPARLPPALERPGFRLYLVDGSEHCMSLTNDPAAAVGVVLAWVDEE